MSQEPATLLAQPAVQQATDRLPVGGARALLLALAVAIGALGSALLGLWHPEPDSGDAFSYAQLQPIRDAWWAYHFFGSVVVVLAGLGSAVAACLLAPTRGRIWATVGAVVLVAGSALFAAGLAAEAALFAYAADPAALPADAGTALMSYVGAHPERYVVGTGLGGVLLTLGPVVVAVALWRARSVPIWVPVALVFSNVAAFFVPFGLVGFALALPGTAAMIVVGWLVWRRSAA